MRNIQNQNYFCLFILGLLFFDLGNVDAIRQGTEGFYLLISKEMFLEESFLTPIIYGAPHWSKPPLQFWLPMPFYSIFGGDFLFFGRLSILLLSLFCTFLISIWYERELKRNWIEAFFFLVTPLYFLKYSRIYMMEIPLTYLSILSSLYFFSYIQKSKNRDLLIAAIFGGLSVLIKGPVSLVMIFPGCFLYALLKENKTKRFYQFTVFATTAVLIGSVWFLLSIGKYGQSFIEYFFIRENLGKFAAKNYPMSSVFQGLLIYSFPTSLLAISFFKHRKRLQLNQATKFLLLNFFFFFFLWLIPKQKSHHYAVPSIPLVSLVISYYFFSLQNEYRLKAFKKLSVFYHGLTLLCVSLGLLLFYFQEYLDLSGGKIYAMGALTCAGLWTHLQKKPLNRAFLLSFLLPLILLWQFILPIAFLPIVPSKVTKIIQSNRRAELFVSHRKPFFIFEATQREGKIVSQKLLADKRIDTGDYLFLSESSYELSPSHKSSYKVVQKWHSWRRGVNLSSALLAIRKKDLRLIQTAYLLVEKI